MKIKAILFISFVLLLVFLLSSCSFVARKAAEKAIEKGAGVEVKEKERKVRVKTKEGEAEFGSKELPRDFPKDFPVYEGGKEIASTRVETSEGISINVSYKVNEDISVVSDFYKSSLPKNGYELQQTVETSDDSVMLNFKKGEKVEGLLNLNKSNGETEIAITLLIKK